MNIRTFFLFFTLLIFKATAFEPSVSYLVADLKYSREHGIKICEVQHGALSALQGDLYLSGGEGTIAPKIADFFTHFPMKKWATGLIYAPLKNSFAATGWEIHRSLNTVLNDPAFIECAKRPPIDPSSITSYGGIIYGALNLVRNFNTYRKAYPGIVFVDAVTFSSWRDKFKMNALFDLHDELKQYKADWRLYPRKYDPLLSERIQQEMPSDIYVIKPRGEILANGVIVIASKDLDEVLQMILEPLPTLEKHPDKKYGYWWKSRDDTFLIEKYYRSDELCLSQGTYDATLRLAFILKSDKGEITYHSLGGFWKLPSKALEEEGTLNEKMVSCCKPPFYHPIDAELFKKVDAEMEKAMLLLYKILLDQHSFFDQR